MQRQQDAAALIAVDAGFQHHGQLSRLARRGTLTGCPPNQRAPTWLIHQLGYLSSLNVQSLPISNHVTTEYSLT